MYLMFIYTLSTSQVIPRTVLDLDTLPAARTPTLPPLPGWPAHDINFYISVAQVCVCGVCVMPVNESCLWSREKQIAAVCWSWRGCTPLAGRLGLDEGLACETAIGRRQSVRASVQS